MAQFHLLTLITILTETPDTKTYQFAHPQSGRIHYKAGQYLTFRLQIGNEIVYRSYSLSSASKLDDFLAVTVKKLPRGKASSFIHAHFKVGMGVEVMEPKGRFYTETATKNRRQVILLGGGSGMTPLMSILRSVLFNEPYSKAALIYSSRNEENIIFKQTLGKLAKMFPDRFALVYMLSQPLDSDAIEHYVGRITHKNLPDILAAIRKWNLPAEYFICGPKGMMEVVDQVLQQQKVPTSTIHHEEFIAADDGTKIVPAGIGPTRKVGITLRGKRSEIMVPSGLTILDAALNHRLDVPYSCKRGLCSSCMARKTAGEISMDNPESLLDFERAQGDVLLCQTYPESDSVEIIV